jgi:hypothetical protein
MIRFDRNVVTGNLLHFCHLIDKLWSPLLFHLQLSQSTKEVTSQRETVKDKCFELHNLLCQLAEKVILRLSHVHTLGNNIISNHKIYWTHETNAYGVDLPCQNSLLEETGVTGETPNLWQSVEWLFTIHMNMHACMTWLWSKNRYYELRMARHRCQKCYSILR